MRAFLVLTNILSAVKGALVRLYSADGQHNVNPDAQLRLTFSFPPTIGLVGKVNVYDSKDTKLVDTLDLSTPFSPSPCGNGSTKANYTDTTQYQTNIIGGLDFYFYPIIVRNNTATIYLHNNRLTYGRTYLIEIEPSVLKPEKGSFNGFNLERPWEFSTKACGPSAGAARVVVAADGSGDFNTIQGAIDVTEKWIYNTARMKYSASDLLVIFQLENTPQLSSF